MVTEVFKQYNMNYRELKEVQINDIRNIYDIKKVAE